MNKLTWSGVEATGVEELRSKMDVNVTKKHEDVAFLPGVGADVQTPTSRKLLIHRDQGVVGEALLPEDMQSSVKAT